MGRITPAQRERIKTDSGPAFESEEDCKQFIEDVRLAKRLEEAQMFLEGFRGALYERFEEVGLDIDADEAVDELVRVENETEFMPVLGVFDTSGHPDKSKNRRAKPLWIVSGVLPLGAWKQEAR